MSVPRTGTNCTRIAISTWSAFFRLLSKVTSSMIARARCHQVARSRRGQSPGKGASWPRTQPALFELAAFAAPSVEPDYHRPAVTRGLTTDAHPDAGKHTAA